MSLKVSSAVQKPCCTVVTINRNIIARHFCLNLLYDLRRLFGILGLLSHCVLQRLLAICKSTWLVHQTCPLASILLTEHKRMFLWPSSGRYISVYVFWYEIEQQTALFHVYSVYYFLLWKSMGCRNYVSMYANNLPNIYV